MTEKKTMTAVVWNEFETVRLFAVEGDWHRLHGAYINTVDTDEDLQSELNDLIYDSQGHRRYENDRVAFCEAIRAGGGVIVCGMIP